MPRFTVAVLVRNQYGVLNRVTSMFRRRRFNINSLTVSETESQSLSRITVSFDGDDTSKEQLINQLYKLPDVCSIKELKDKHSVNCELALVKVEINPETRDEIMAAAEAFRAKIVDYTRESMVLQLTDATDRVDAFVGLMETFEILEICRTGVVSLERGSTTIRKTEYI